MKKAASAVEASEKRRPVLKLERQPQPQGGRPPLLELNPELLNLLHNAGRIGCTVSEMAALLGVGESLLYEFFKKHPEAKEHFLAAAAIGRVSLRRAQLRVAEAGNAKMLIWLGKQWLGQRDRPQQMDQSSAPVDFSVLTDAEVGFLVTTLRKAGAGQQRLPAPTR